MADSGGFSRGFVSLQHRSFRLLFLSNVTSGAGAQIQQVANLWQVYALTGSAVHLGLTGLARAIPIILFSLAGGVIADRVDRKKIILVTQMTNGALALVIAVLSFTDLIEVWHIYAAVFLNATMVASAAPARRAVVASLVPREHLMNAMALQSTVQQVDRIVAPALAGVIIAVVGLPLAYATNGFTHFLTASILTFVSLGPLPDKPAGSPLRNLMEGLAFVRQRSIILVLLATDAAAMLFGYYNALLPLIAGNYDVGPIGFGLLSSAAAIGGMFATSVVMYLGDFPYKGWLITSSILCYCAFLVMLAVSPWFWLAFVAVIGLGLADSLQATPRNAVIQLMTPDGLRGRVSSFQQMLVTGMPALGQTSLGAAVGALGLPIAMVGGALICAAINIGIFAGRPELRARRMGMVEESEPISGEVAARAP